MCSDIEAFRRLFPKETYGCIELAARISSFSLEELEEFEQLKDCPGIAFVKEGIMETRPMLRSVKGVVMLAS